MTDEKKEKDIVMPGDELSTVEELEVGDGTFDDEGIIRAARLGKYKVDSKNRCAIVSPLTSVPVMVQYGDIVLGDVKVARSTMIVMNIVHVEGKNRNVSGENVGTIRVSEIANGYVKDATHEFGIGDYIRGRVISTRPSIQISTKDSHYGSIKSLCTRCRNPMVKKGGNNLECPNCGYRQRRNITDDYGNVNPDNL